MKLFLTSRLFWKYWLALLFSITLPLVLAFLFSALRVPHFFFLMGIGIVVSFLIALRLSKPFIELKSDLDALLKGIPPSSIFANHNNEIGHLERGIRQLGRTLQIQKATAEEEKNQLRGILNSMIEGVLVTNFKSEIVLTNQALKTFFQLTDGAMGKKVLECFGQL